jgi:hypothetical protein
MKRDLTGAFAIDTAKVWPRTGRYGDSRLAARLRQAHQGDDERWGEVIRPAGIKPW